MLPNKTQEIFSGTKLGEQVACEVLVLYDAWEQ
jgi:hypothetical protein